jgi:membrane protease YdiL (CAAX protease family)
VIVRPLFEHVRMWHIVVISMLAGLGEELLFRGVLQPLIGLPLASLIFGAVHVGGRTFIGYGVWAACIGAVFGWLMMVTGGLLAPIVAHAVYDMLALAYVRYGPTDIYAIELDSNAS